MFRYFSVLLSLGLAGLVFVAPPAAAQESSGPPRAKGAEDRPLVLEPDRVFDGVAPEAHPGWVVVVRGERIAAAGPKDTVPMPEGARLLRCRGRRCCRGSSMRTRTSCFTRTTRCRGTTRCSRSRWPCASAARRTTFGSTCSPGSRRSATWARRGAGYADVGLKQAVEQGIVPGPRLLVATRAIVASRSYAPAGFAPEVDVPQGAEEADGDALRRVVRDEIGRGADLIKVYADNAHGATFALDELTLIVETARGRAPRRRPCDDP